MDLVLILGDTTQRSMPFKAMMFQTEVNHAEERDSEGLQVDFKAFRRLKPIVVMCGIDDGPEGRVLNGCLGNVL